MNPLLSIISPLVYFLLGSQFNLSGPTLAYCQQSSVETGWTRKEGNKDEDTHSSLCSTYNSNKGNEGHKNNLSISTCVGVGLPQPSSELPGQSMDHLLKQYQVKFLTQGQENLLNHPEELSDDMTKYQVTLSNGDINYSPKEGVNLVTVLYDHEPVWRHEPVRDREEYPLKVVLNFNLGVLSVDTHSRSRLYLFDNNRWVHRLTTDLRSSSAPLLSLDSLYPSGRVEKKEELEESEDKLEKEEETLTGPKEVKVTTEDRYGNTHVNDISKYKVYRREGVDVFVYIFNKNVKCIKITHHGVEVWNRESNDSVMDWFLYEKTPTGFLLFFGQEYIKYRLNCSASNSSNCSWVITDSTMPIPSKYHPREVTVITEGSTSENDISKYSVFIPQGENHSFLYTFNKGHKCTMIKWNDKVVWKHDKIGPLPGSFLYNSEDHFTLWFHLDHTTYRLNQSGEWGLACSTLPLPPKYHPSEIKVTTASSDGTTAVNDTDKYKVIKAGGDDTYSYTLNSGANCTMITHEGKELWKLGSPTSNNQHPKSFIYNKDSKLILFFADGLRTYYLNSSASSRKAEKGIDLVIGSSPNKDQYKRIGNNDKFSFIPKPGYGFQSVKTGNNTFWTGINNMLAKAVLIWLATERSYTAIILPGGKFELFYGNTKRETEYSLTDLKFYHTESGKQELVPTDKYEDDILTSKFSYGFKFKDNVKVTEVKYRDISLGTFDKHYPSGVYLDFVTNKFFVMVGEMKKGLDISKIDKP